MLDQANTQRSVSEQEPPSESHPPPADSRPPAKYALRFFDGSLLVVRGRGFIGREPAAPDGGETAHLVALRDPGLSVSRTHLEFGLSEIGLWVRDCGSTNGSEVESGGQRRAVEPGQIVPVQADDAIYIAGQRISVEGIDTGVELGPVTIDWGAATHAGPDHRRNEDSFGAQPPAFVVADGMGGHSAGERASQEAVEAFTALDAKTPVTAEAVDEALADARARIARIPVDDGGRPPGTTVSGVIVDPSSDQPSWTVVNIGDSRTYRLDDDGLSQLSVDHSLVQELIAAGTIDEETARNMPFRNVLKRAVLGETEYAADVSRVPMNEGDRILVCSDGVSSVVDDQTISEVLSTVQDPHDAARALVDTATSAGGRDDATAVVVDATAVNIQTAATRPVWRPEP